MFPLERFLAGPGARVDDGPVRLTESHPHLLTHSFNEFRAARAGDKHDERHFRHDAQAQRNDS